MITTWALVTPYKPWAKTETTKMLIMKDTNRAIEDSTKKYMLACLTADLFFLSTSRDYPKIQN